MRRRPCAADEPGGDGERQEDGHVRRGGGHGGGPRRRGEDAEAGEPVARLGQRRQVGSDELEMLSGRAAAVVVMSRGAPRGGGAGRWGSSAAPPALSLWCVGEMGDRGDCEQAEHQGEQGDGEGECASFGGAADEGARLTWVA